MHGSLLLSALFASCLAFAAVDLLNVQSLTFYAGQYTTGRRTSPVPQLKCIGGDGCHLSHLVKVVQCKNQGPNQYGEPDWKCESHLDKRIKFGRTDVSCEGYTSSSDRLKLAGSCGLEYELFLQPVQYQTTETKTTHDTHHYRRPINTYHYASTNDGSVIFLVLVLIIVILAACSTCM